MAYKKRLFTELCSAALTAGASAAPSITMFAGVTLAAAMTSAQVIVDLGSLGAGCVGPRVRALSADGSTVVGDLCSAAPNGFPQAWHWDGVLGMQSYPNGYAATAVSANGAYATGSGSFPAPTNNKPVRWLPGGGTQILPTLGPWPAHVPTGISDNGGAISGYLFQLDSPYDTKACRWDLAGPTIQNLGGAFGQLPHSMGTCISGDGSTVVGVRFNIGTTRWRTGFPPELLPTLPGSSPMYPQSANSDGSAFVGSTDTPGGRRGLRWRDIDGMQELLIPPGYFGSEATDLTSDAKAVVGYLYVTPFPNAVPTAAYWTSTYGWTDLNTYLPTLGVNLSGWVLQTCMGVSDDGTVVAGNGLHNGQPAAWLVRNIPSLCGARFEIPPANVTGCALTTKSFSMLALPPEETFFISVYYQWYKRVVFGLGYADVPMTDGPGTHGETFSGAASEQFTIANMSPFNAGDYFCRVSAGCGTRDTALVSLTVLPNISGNGGPVGTADLVIVLGNFGTNVPPWTNGDLNGDGVVNTADLTAVLGMFGVPCP